MQSASHCRTICITSGKGGVGKTNCTANLGIQLAQNNKKVLLVDADFGLANMDILLNVRPKVTIENVVAGNHHIKDVIINTEFGVQLLPAASGIPSMTTLQSEHQKALIVQLAELQKNLDYLLIDTGAGINPSILRFCASVDEVIIITTTEPTAITDAYAMMKILANQYQVREFYLIINQSNMQQAEYVYKLILQVALKSRQAYTLNFLGNIPQDSSIVESVRQRCPISISHPKAAATQAFKKITARIATQQLGEFKPESFWQRLFSSSDIASN